MQTTSLISYPPSNKTETGGIYCSLLSFHYFCESTIWTTVRIRL